MKFATLKNGSRDGALIVVSRDLSRCVSAAAVAPTLQAALDNWEFTAPQLAALYDALNQGSAAEAQPFDQSQCHSGSGHKSPARGTPAKGAVPRRGATPQRDQQHHVAGPGEGRAADQEGEPAGDGDNGNKLHQVAVQPQRAFLLASHCIHGTTRAQHAGRQILRGNTVPLVHT